MQLVFATHNANKLREVKAILPQSIKLLSLNDINCFEGIAETADTIEGNAKLKAEYVFKNFNLPCFADDTGLFVEALDGEPGVYSARYAGPEKNSKANNDKLLHELKSAKSRKAFFKTVIAFQDKECDETFTGFCHGEILKTPIGNEGFGYDPIFKPKGYDHSFASLNSDIKNKISHRKLALEKFLDFLNYKYL